MPTYISLLRGINVAGKKKIKMAELKVMYEQLGYTDVISYIQSGNVIFKTKKTAVDQLAKVIKAAIMDTFGFEVPTLILSRASLQKLIEANPYKDRDVEPKFLHLTILANPPAAEKAESFKALSFPGEAFSLAERVVYLCLPNGYGRTKLNNNFIESKLKVQATTRNLKSANKILKLAGD